MSADDEKHKTSAQNKHFLKAHSITQYCYDNHTKTLMPLKINFHNQARLNAVKQVSWKVLFLIYFMCKVHKTKTITLPKKERGASSIPIYNTNDVSNLQVKLLFRINIYHLRCFYVILKISACQSKLAHRIIHIKKMSIKWKKNTKYETNEKFSIPPQEQACAIDICHGAQ